MIKKVDRLGRIAIPIMLRNEMNIHMDDDVEIFLENHQVIIKKYHAEKPCMITGQVNKENYEFAHGKIVLSPDGVRVLLKELEKLHIK